MSANGHRPAERPPQTPVPTSFEWAAVVDGSGNQWVVLTVCTPVGLQTFWLPPDTARQLGAGMLDVGTQAKSGLIVPEISPEQMREIGRRALGGDDSIQA